MSSSPPPKSKPGDGLASVPLTPMGTLQSDDHVVVEVPAPKQQKQQQQQQQQHQHHLDMEAMLQLSPSERKQHWELPPSPGYAYMKNDRLYGKMFGYDFPIDRRLVLVAGVCVQMCVGTLYAFSVFVDPIHKAGQGVRQNWSDPGYAYGMAVFFLGTSAAFTGTILERRGPRFTGCFAALFWSLGHFLSALAVEHDQEWLFYVGYGFFGGLGLGFGYVTPVSPMVKYYPDKRGLASGLAVMGFGLGAVIATHVNSALIHAYGVANAFAILGVIYGVIILAGAQYMTRPPICWAPPGFEYDVQAHRIREGHNVTTRLAMTTPHFWLCWLVLFCCILTGVSVFSQAKPIMKDVFKVTGETADLVLSLWAVFNCGGRVFWSWTSDLLALHGLSRKYNYMFYCGAQAVLVITFPFITKHTSLFPLFAGMVCFLISMYGGNFGTIPAFLADLFGPQNVGAIHGVVLTAWGCAGGAGSIAISTIKDQRKKSGVPSNELYDPFFYLGFGVLMVGVVCAALVRPLISKRGELRMQLGWGETIRRKWAKSQQQNKQAAAIPSTATNASNNINNNQEHDKNQI